MSVSGAIGMTGVIFFFAAVVMAVSWDGSDYHEKGFARAALALFTAAAVMWITAIWVQVLA